MDNANLTSSFIFKNKIVPSNRETSIDFHKMKKKSLSSFYKNKKVSNYGLLIQNIKLDNQSIQDSIKENSDILIYYKNPKICNMNKNFMKKIEDIEKNKRIDYNNNDTLRDFDFELMMEDYSCTSQNELLIKINTINQHYETFLRNLIDYSFLLNLKYNNEKWKFEERFQETYSKFLWLKDIIECLVEKSKYIQETKDNLKNFDIISEENFNFEILRPQRLRRLETFNSVNNSTLNFEESNVEALSQFLVKNYDDKFEDYRRRSSKELPYVGFQDYSNKDLPKISIVEERKNNDESIFEDKLKLKDEEIKILKKVIEDCKITLNLVSKKFERITIFDEKQKDKLLNDNRELIRKNNELKSTLNTTNLELNNMKKSYDSLAKNIKKGKNHFEAYEEILKDGFEEMRSSFIKKFDELSKDFASLKTESNRKIIILECELKKSNEINDVLLKHLNKF